MASQNVGATTPSEKFSARLSMAARATPGLVEHVRIPPHDLRHRPAGGVESLLFKRLGHPFDMLMEASLGDQRARQIATTTNPNGSNENPLLFHRPPRPGPRRSGKQRRIPRPCDGCRCGLAVERAVEPVDHPADPHHWMADGAQHAAGIAECCFDQQGQ